MNRKYESQFYESENRQPQNEDFENEEDMKEAFKCLKEVISINGNYKFEDEADILNAAIDVIKALEGEVWRKIAQGELTDRQMEKLRNPYFHVSLCFTIHK